MHIRISLIAAFFLLLINAEKAEAELQEVKINGKVYTETTADEAAKDATKDASKEAPKAPSAEAAKETAKEAPKEAPKDFSPSEGLDLARSARAAKAKLERDHSDAGAEKCFRLMRETAATGECSRTFWAADATCAEEDSSGCFENKRFLHRLERLGFRLAGRALSEKDEGECRSVTAHWCEVVNEGAKRKTDAKEM